MIFIDTSAFVALHYPGDPRHADARTGFRRLKDERLRTLTSNLVLGETFAILDRYAGFAHASEVLRTLYDARRLEILRPLAATERTALALLRRHRRFEPSFVDCVSFALMDEHGISQAFAHDRDFAHAGFALWPGDAPAKNA